MARLTDVTTGDLITAERQNIINDYINDGVEYINTAYLQVSGTTVIDSSRNVDGASISSNGRDVIRYAFMMGR